MTSAAAARERNQADEHEICLSNSGASRHMTSSKEGIYHFRPSIYQYVRTAGGYKLKIAGNGLVDLQFFSEGQTVDVTLNNIAIVPELYFNLFSLTAVVDLGMEYHGKPSGIHVFDEDLVFKKRDKMTLHSVYAGRVECKDSANPAVLTPDMRHEKRLTFICSTAAMGICMKNCCAPPPDRGELP